MSTYFFSRKCIPYLILICGLSFASYHSKSQTLSWIKSFGSTLQTGIMDVAIQNDSTIYLSGFYRGTVDFDPGPGTLSITSVSGGIDAFIMKVDSSGNLIWVRVIAGASVEQANKIQIDNAGNIYAAGVYSGNTDFNPGTGVFNMNGTDNVFVLKLNSDGDFIWAKKFGGNGIDRVDGFKIQNQQIYMTGSFSQTADFDPNAGVVNLVSAGFDDIYLLNLDTAGSLNWVKQIGGTNNQKSLDIAFDSHNNILLTGYYRGTVDFDPSANTFTYTTTNLDEVFIAKYSSTGNFIWAKQIAGSANARGNSIITDALDNVYIAGSFTYTYDFDPGPAVLNITANGNPEDVFYMRLDSNGLFNWVRTFGGNSNDYGYGIKLDAVGRLMVLGSFSSLNVNFDNGFSNFTASPTGSDDLYLLLSDTAGNFINAKFIDGTYTGISFKSNNDFILVGSYQGSLQDFDPSANTYNLPSLPSLSSHAFYGKYSSALNIALPIELFDFTVSVQQNNALLSWSTHEEINEGSFFIQRSLDGVHFITIGHIAASCNQCSPAIFNFTDFNINELDASVIYYRIVSVDIENACSYSTIQSIILQHDNQVQLFPNPASVFLHVSGDTFKEIDIYTVLGKHVYKAKTEIDKHTQLNISYLAPGIYFIKMRTAKNQFIERCFEKI